MEFLLDLYGNNRLAKVCLQGPRLLAEHFFHRSMEIFPVITWDYCSQVNQVKFPKDFSQCIEFKKLILAHSTGITHPHFTYPPL